MTLLLNKILYKPGLQTISLDTPREQEGPRVSWPTGAAPAHSLSTLGPRVRPKSVCTKASHPTAFSSLCSSPSALPRAPHEPQGLLRGYHTLHRNVVTVVWGLLPLSITLSGAGEAEEAKISGPFVACSDRHPIDSSISHWQSPLYHSGTAAPMPRIPHRLASPRGATREAPVSAKNLMVVWQVYKS